jgi:hypothetical protein
MWQKQGFSMPWLRTQTSISFVLGSAANSSWQRAEISPVPCWFLTEISQVPVLIPDRNYLLAKLLLLSSAIPMLVCKRFKPVGTKRF